MKIRILPFVAALVLVTVSAFGAPEPGRYVGVLTVQKNLGVFTENLSSSYTLKAEARVFADGRITILPTVAESPSAAANPQSTVLRAAPIEPQPVPLGWGSPLAIHSFAFPKRSPGLTFDLRASFTGITGITPVFTYLVESLYPALVTTEGTLLKIRYETERRNEANNIDFTLPYSAFSFVFRKQAE